jgi:hypothetical protein
VTQLRAGLKEQQWRGHHSQQAVRSRAPHFAAAADCRLYAFDVHCNSYFPLFLLLYGEHAPVA